MDGTGEKKQNKLKLECSICHGKNQPVIFHKQEGSDKFICSTCEIDQLKQSINEIGSIALDWKCRRDYVEKQEKEIARLSKQIENDRDMINRFQSTLAENQTRIAKLEQELTRTKQRANEQLQRAKEEYSFSFCLACSEEFRGDRDCSKEGICEHLEEQWKKDVLGETE